ncbi:MAG TPA: R3H domain-containing nucleic acid-binding protein [Candidatus Moranbacteria bacterium]|jgi:spoIIIJ-associated protein|nr:R3H domain-containing nucleic acid-binding protein [Candidatus Moranbacteria bacterium]HQB59357.1 R3H domain-containing nucleic acid-binding protein [Candidatus Moranbacteria bacterium]
MNEKTISTIKETVEEILEKMGFSASVAISQEKEDSGIICDITTEKDSNFLIGQHGSNLQAIQHIARLIIRKRIEEKTRFILDVNSYRQQKNQSIIEQALSAAEEAIAQHRAIVMKPMSTYERRIVHLELSKNPKITTESTGEGEERKVIVKPSDLI